MTCPNANEETINKKEDYYQYFLLLAFIFNTLKKIIETTPSKEATTNGRISKAPRLTTERKIIRDLFALSLL